jgi:hypothetical protein
VPRRIDPRRENGSRGGPTLTEEREISNEDLTVPEYVASRRPSGRDPGTSKRRAAAGGQRHLLVEERPRHLRPLARGHSKGKALDPPGQLHHRQRRDREPLRRRPLGESLRGRAGAGNARLVRLYGCAPLLLEGHAPGRRTGQGRKPARFGTSPRVYPARPPQAARRGRGVRLHGWGVHLRRLAREIPRHGFALPRHRPSA